MVDYPKDYVDYLIHFHADRDYFECHEILEAYWKDHWDDPLRPIWLALIQTAVAMYHHRRGNAAGAGKMIRGAIANFGSEDLGAVGIDSKAFLHLLQKRFNLLQEQTETPYIDLNIPLTDMELVRTCQNECRERGVIWGHPSDLTNDQTVNKHKLRDRSDVIASRNSAWESKRKERWKRDE